MPAETTEYSSLSELVESLSAMPRDRDRYHAALEGIRFGMPEIEKFCHFDEKFYTRNLVARTDDFELIILCWQPGQMTPIHDHAGSDGWVYGMSGTIEEVRYRTHENADGTIEVERFADGQLMAAGLGYINDDIGLHTIANVGDGPAVSMHLYAPPIDECLYFSEGDRCFKTREMSYYSVNGKARS